LKTTVIQTEYITLSQFLKLAECIQTGGQAKFFLQETMIKVNEEVEKRRGKKLRNNDIIEVEGFGTYKVVRQ